MGGVSVETLLGDITELKVDAIINAANSDLWMGAGVAGAIKSRGGAEIEEEAISLGPIKPGNAVMTTGGKLPSRYVIHCAGMPPGGSATYWNVRNSVSAAIDIACESNLESLAVPAIGAGIGGLTSDESAKAIAESIAEYTRRTRSVKKILLVGLDQGVCDSFESAIEDAFIDLVMVDMQRDDE
ncbi:MAG: macro domain-containing protein [Candidatus Hodarchaeota archaeon]